MGQTIVEKIISSHAGRTLYAGNLCIAELDFFAGTDTKSPRSIHLFKELGIPLLDAKRMAIVMDHFVPCTSAHTANVQQGLFNFTTEHGIRLFPPGNGISLQLFMEHAMVLPGQLAGIAESHAASLGALNCCCLAIGEAEFAVAMATGKTWLKVPETIRVNLEGKLQRGVSPKDLALKIMGSIGTEGAAYQVLEFQGSAVNDFDMSARFTLCNMVSDIGAKTAVMPGDAQTTTWLQHRTDSGYTMVSPDQTARYHRELTFDAGSLLPMLACPHTVDNVSTVAEHQGVPIHVAILGSCTNGRLEDLQTAAAVLRGKQIPPSVRLLVTPASRQVLLDAEHAGLTSDLVQAGALIMPPGCGPCTSFTQIGVPGDNATVISSANRNFKGRLGNKTASIYLSSPATVAASALNGCITDPRPYFA